MGSENEMVAVTETVAFVQEWLANSDYEPTTFDRDFAAAIDARTLQVNEVLVREMVSRFLAWTLPADFAPDAGISYCPPTFLGGEMRPTGTNLLTAAQTEDMVRHLLAARLAPAQPDAQQGEVAASRARLLDAATKARNPDNRDATVAVSVGDLAVLLSATPSSTALDAATIERCAQVAYAVCAETRHVALGDKVAAAIRALLNAEKRHG